MRKFVVSAWSYIFDHDLSPLRHIQDTSIRHMVFQMLAWMWSIVFGIYVGSYIAFGVTLVAHALLISAAAITVATYTVASTKPKIFALALGRRADGEHD
jgi:hypothetical protein